MQKTASSRSRLGIGYRAARVSERFTGADNAQEFGRRRGQARLLGSQRVHGLQPGGTARGDIGRGQRYYLFGTNAAYAEIVGYYKNIMKNGGRTIFEAPAMQQWDLGKSFDTFCPMGPWIATAD